MRYIIFLPISTIQNYYYYIIRVPRPTLRIRMRIT